MKPKLPVLTPINAAGRSALRAIDEFGAAAIFLLRAFVQIFRVKQIPLIIQQVYYINAGSANIVMLVGLFTGMVVDAISDTAKEFYEQFGFTCLSDDRPRLFLPLKSMNL